MTAPDILSPEFAANPYPHYKTLRDEYPLAYHEGFQSYILSRYEDVEKAFKDPVFTSKNYEWQLEPVHGRTILQMDGREHATHRNLLTPAFRGRDLQEKFIPVIQANAKELIDGFRDGGDVDFVEAFARRFPISVIVDMLGLPRTDLPLFARWYTSIIDFLSNLTGDPGVTERGLQTQRELQDYMLPIIADRRANPGTDLLSTLCTSEIDGVRMTDLEIKAFVSLLLAAGGETTDKAMANLLKDLLEHPDQMQLVRQDRSMIEKATAEMLRYSPPVHMIMRTPSEDVEVSGGVIPAGKTVTCLIGAANRDDRVYANPDTFDITRTDLDMKQAFSGAANHTAFALGRHFCVGAILAKTEIEIATNQLLDAFSNIEFANGTPAEEGVFTRAPKTMMLRFTPA
ncbi:MAG: cytochrome P450 [bacterium]|nr:cytochrome P450 [bacterium]